MMFDTIRFDGDTIGVAKLKKEIIARKKLCTTNGGVCYFDLRLFNADTNEEFFDGGLVPKNTLVLVTRLPKPGRPFRRPPLRTAVSAPDNKSHRPVIPESTTEESRLSAVVNMRVEDILPAKSGRCSRSPLPPGSLPPPGYVCHRCGIAGHYIQHCPTNSQRVLSYRGIPGFLRGPSSEFVMKPNEGIFQSALKSTLFCKGVMDTCDDSLKCPVCHNLVVDAVELSCCHDSLCSNCAWDKLLQTDMHCPLCNQTVTAQDVIPNRALRQLVEETKKEMLSKYVETTFSNSMGKCKGSIPGDHNTELLPSPPSSLNSAQQNTPPITQDSSQNTPPGTPPNTPPHQATPPSSPHQSMNEPIVKYKDDPAGVASVIDAKNMKVEVQTLKLEEPGNVLDAAKPVYVATNSLVTQCTTFQSK
ncbi:E3 ubiquitin-protein ligase RBBP6 [Pelomyxa schiedti]|nr:E3 ubiquitin-protein ligase RBBP6 [Pelomyxa schiedti]